MFEGNHFKDGLQTIQENLTPETIGVGVDIENISRFENSNIVKNTSFLERVFTQKELDYCYSNQFPAQHLAARFAGKEAIIKAASGMKKEIFSYHDIQIINNKSGAPSATIQKECFNDIAINISLSHARDLAIAFVIITQPVRKEV